MDIDTLTIVSLQYCIISTEHKKEMQQRVVEKNPFTRVFELIYEALTKISWCYDVCCLHMMNGMLTIVLFSLLFFCCYSVLNV